MVTSPAPATSNPACGSPAPGFPVRFMPRVMGPLMSGTLSAVAHTDGPGTVEQPEPLVQPRPTPPPPTEAPTLPGTHQVPPHLLLHPVADEREAAARMADREIVHPAPEDRVDQLDHPGRRLGLEATEDLLELPQQSRPLRQLWRV